MANRGSRRKNAQRRNAPRKPHAADRSNESRGPQRKSANPGRKRPADEALALSRARPNGPVGLLVMFVVAWILVALVAALGYPMERWNTVGRLDSLWLYVLIGSVAASPAVGYVARGRGDVVAWLAQASLAAAALVAVERLQRPRCTGSSCQHVGASGQLEWWGTALTFVLLLLAGLFIGRLLLDRALPRRAEPSRATVGRSAATMLFAFLLVGLPVALVLVGVDMLVRKHPQRVLAAQYDVFETCLPLEAAPTLYTRPDPQQRSSVWTSYVVGRENEKRDKVGGQPLSKAVKGAQPSPYEALVSLGPDGRVTAVHCRYVASDSGKAPQEALTTEPPEPGTNPLTVPPQFDVIAQLERAGSGPGPGAQLPDNPNITVSP